MRMSSTITPPGVASVVRETHAPALDPATPVVLDWPVGAESGAELLALQLTLRMQGAANLRVVPFLAAIEPGKLPLTPAEYDVVRRAFEGAGAEGDRLFRLQADTLPALGLRWLGDKLLGMPDPIPRPLRHNVGIVSSCVAAFDAEARSRAQRCDLLLAGSTWMRDALAAAGITHSAVMPPGFDPAVFAPGEKSGHLRQRFVIFSAGRMHLRKGQDLVLAAVKRFRQRHPETLLLTAWQTPWPESVGDMSRAGHVSGALQHQGESLDVAQWATANGLPAGSVVDLGMLPQHALAVAMREADVALFPNRAETDVNPLVLECMATGVPTIVSRNTGHRDVAHDALCYPLTQQGPVKGMPVTPSTEGWGESSVDEIVAQLESVHAQTSAARARAAAAQVWVQAFAWPEHLPRWLAALEPFARGR